MAFQWTSSVEGSANVQLLKHTVFVSQVDWAASLSVSFKTISLCLFHINQCDWFEYSPSLLVFAYPLPLESKWFTLDSYKTLKNQTKKSNRIWVDPQVKS